MKTGKVGTMVDCDNCQRPCIAGAGYDCIDGRDMPGYCSRCGGEDYPQPRLIDQPLGQGTGAGTGPQDLGTGEE